MISIEDLSFGYRRANLLIENLTWEFPPGNMTAITGPSGRGKSTLLYLMGLLLSPLSGCVFEGGRNLSGLSDAARSSWRASKVGFVFQDAALDLSRTVLDNIIEPSLYSKLDRQEAIARARKLMKRLDVHLQEGHRPGEVSGGQAQRIALCRALIAEPQLILADEPTGNLDIAAARTVIDVLAMSARDDNRIVVVATHDEHVASRCDSVLEL